MQSAEAHGEVDREVYQEVDQSSPTDKPKAHQDAIYLDYWEVEQEVYEAVDQDSTEAAF
jgi:hypothetical protein